MIHFDGQIYTETIGEKNLNYILEIKKTELFKAEVRFCFISQSIGQARTIFSRPFFTLAVAFRVSITRLEWRTIKSISKTE